MNRVELATDIDHAYQDFIARCPGVQCTVQCVGEKMVFVRQLTPTPWDGEGLPPVGTVCISNATGNSFFEAFAGRELEIVMHDVSMDGKPIAVFRWPDPEELEESEGECASYLYAGMIAGSFEPIKTAEQIAADERLHKVRNACTAIAQATEAYNVNVECSAAMRAVVEAMIDEGYAK